MSLLDTIYGRVILLRLVDSFSFIYPLTFGGDIHTNLMVELSWIIAYVIA